MTRETTVSSIPKGVSAKLPSVSVVLPTYRRPRELLDCLQGLSVQNQLPLEVIVVRRASDDATGEALSAYRFNHREVIVVADGVVAALQAGADVAQGEVVAFIDDDAVPRLDWVAKISAQFVDKCIGGVGGRDLVHTTAGVIQGSELRVGTLTFCGRAVGNHHIGVGQSRGVDTLKGCNMAIRRECLALPGGLRGGGAQIAWDMAAALWAKAQGYSLIYDPSIIVDHYPGARPDGLSRGLTTPSAQYDSVYNPALVICALRPHLRWRYLLYHMVVGTRGAPGLIRWLVGMIRGEGLTSLLVSQRALLAGVLDSRRGTLTFRRIPDCPAS